MREKNRFSCKYQNFVATGLESFRAVNFQLFEAFRPLLRLAIEKLTIWKNNFLLLLFLCLKYINHGISLKIVGGNKEEKLSIAFIFVLITQKS